MKNQFSLTLAMAGCLGACAAGAAPSDGVSDEATLEQELRTYALEAGFDPNAGSYIDKGLTYEGDIRIEQMHLDPLKHLGYDLEEALGIPIADLEASDAGSATRKGRFYRDIDNRRPGKRVTSNNPTVNELKVCYWGDSDGDEENEWVGIGAHIYAVRDAVDEINATGSRIKASWRYAKDGSACDGLGYKVRVFKKKLGPGTCAQAPYPVNIPNFGNGNWIVPGAQVAVNSVAPVGCRGGTTVKVTMLHEMLHGLGFSHSNTSSLDNTTGEPSHRLGQRVDNNGQFVGWTGGIAEFTEESVMRHQVHDGSSGVNGLTSDDQNSIRFAYPR